MYNAEAELTGASTQRSIRLVRWLGMLGVTVALGMLALGGVVLLDARTDAWERAEQASANLTLALERDVARNLASYDLSIRGVIAALRQPGIENASPEVRQMAMFDRAAAADYLGSLLVLDPRGKVVASSMQPVPSGLDLSDRDYFRIHQERADAGLFVSRPFRSRLRGGDVSVALSRRVDAPGGSFGGIAVGTLRLAYFRDLFGALDLGPGGSVALVSIDGRLLARSPFREEDADRDVSGGIAFQRFMETGASSSVASATADGIERLYSFRRVGNLPLIFSVAHSTEDVFSAWRHKALSVGAMLTLLSGALVALCLLFRREVLRRLAAETSLARAAGELAVAATTDGLTGLANRRRFDEVLGREWRRAAREGTELSLVLLDVDRFKPFNDRYGHQAGDGCLRALAGAVGQIARRPADLAARYGGEEMVLVLPQTDVEGAAQMAEKTRAAVERLRVAHEGNSPAWVVTVSLGVASAMPMPGSDAEAGARALLAAADAALYRAKEKGRNRAEVAAPLVEAVTLIPGFMSARQEPTSSPGTTSSTR